MRSRIPSHRRLYFWNAFSAARFAFFKSEIESTIEPALLALAFLRALVAMSPTNCGRSVRVSWDRRNRSKDGEKHYTTRRYAPLQTLAKP